MTAPTHDNGVGATDGDLLGRVEDLCTWLAATTIDELELTGPGGSIRLVRNASGGVEVQPASTGETHDSPVPITVPAASVGVFLNRHPWQEEPLAPVGTLVDPGAQLGFLQVGPLLTVVLSPTRAVVTGAPVPHGAIVGFGDPLFELEQVDHHEP